MSEQDPTHAAFLREVTSDEFWEVLDARRKAVSADESRRIAAEYRRRRAQRAAEELRRRPE